MLHIYIFFSKNATFVLCGFSYTVTEIDVVSELRGRGRGGRKGEGNKAEKERKRGRERGRDSGMENSVC